MRRSDIIKKAICANSGLPVPDTDFYERKYSGQDRSGLMACSCKECRAIEKVSKEKMRR